MRSNSKSKRTSSAKGISSSAVEAVYGLPRASLNRWRTTGLLRNLAGPGERPLYDEREIQAVAALKEQGTLRAGVSLARLQAPSKPRRSKAQKSG